MSDLGIPLVHSPRFHQARPEDYDGKELEARNPLSFHKFVATDPIKTYEKYFEKGDRKLVKLSNEESSREEL